MPYKPYEFFKNVQPACFDTVRFHFEELFKTIKRKISKRSTVRHPWRVVAHEKIYAPLFMRWFNAFKDHSPGDPYKTYETEYFKNGNKKLCTIKLTYIGSLKFHMSGAFEGGNYVDDCLKKKIGKFVGSLVINGSNPFIILYNFKTHTLTVDCKYMVVNRFGNKISH